MTPALLAPLSAAVAAANLATAEVRARFRRVNADLLAGLDPADLRLLVVALDGPEPGPRVRRLMARWATPETPAVRRVWEEDVHGHFHVRRLP